MFARTAIMKQTRCTLHIEETSDDGCFTLRCDEYVLIDLHLSLLVWSIMNRLVDFSI